MTLRVAYLVPGMKVTKMPKNKIKKKQHIGYRQGRMLVVREIKGYFWNFLSPIAGACLTYAPKRGYNTLPTALSSTYMPRLSLRVEMISSSFPLKKWMEDEMLLMELHFCEQKFRVQRRFHSGDQIHLPGECYDQQQWTKLRQKVSILSAKGGQWYRKKWKNFQRKGCEIYFWKLWCLKSYRQQSSEEKRDGNGHGLYELPTWIWNLNLV